MAEDNDDDDDACPSYYHHHQLLTIPCRALQLRVCAERVHDDQEQRGDGGPTPGGGTPGPVPPAAAGKDEGGGWGKEWKGTAKGNRMEEERERGGRNGWNID